MAGLDRRRSASNLLPSGQQLFYRAIDGRLMVCAYREVDGAFTRDAPYPWPQPQAPVLTES